MALPGGRQRANILTVFARNCLSQLNLGFLVPSGFLSNASLQNYIQMPFIKLSCYYP